MGGSNGMLDGGNVIVSAPYYVGGRSGTLTAIGGVGATGELFAVRNAGRLVDGVLINVPLRISRISLGFAALTAYTAGSFAFELHKVTGFTAQDTGGTQLQAIARKVTGYPAIATSEVDVMIANTAALTVGTYTVVGSGNTPIAFSTGASSTTLPGWLNESWVPEDMCPWTLEQNEGLVLRNTVAQAAGTGVLFVGLDFLRQ